MICDDFFEIAPEVFIQRDRRVALLCLFEDFGNGTSATVWRADYGNRPVVFLLDDDFVATFDASEGGTDVAGKLGFCDTQRHPIFDCSCARFDVSAGSAGDKHIHDHFSGMVSAGATRFGSTRAFYSASGRCCPMARYVLSSKALFIAR